MRKYSADQTSPIKKKNKQEKKKAFDVLLHRFFVVVSTHIML